MPFIRMAGVRVLAASLLFAVPSGVQAAVAEADLDRIRQSLQQLQKQHEEDARRIRELEQRLTAAESRATPPSREGANQTSATPVSPTPDKRKPTDKSAPAAVAASGNGFNPEIGVTLMGTYGHFSNSSDPAAIPGFALGDESTSAGTQGFSLGESEISLSANIDHLLHGQLTFSLAPEGGAEVEEAFIQTTSLPYGLSLKGGRFLSGVGYLNEQHAHAWDFLDAPLAYRAMLNGQLGDDGVQLRWSAPTPILLQFGVEGLRGGGYPATPTHGGVGANTLFVKAGGDLNESHSWLVSLARHHAAAYDLVTGPDSFIGTHDLIVAGLVWKWAPDGNAAERHLKLQGEYFQRRQEGEFNTINQRGDQNGFYAQAVYQFMPRWSLGARYDRLHVDAVDPALAGTALDNLGHTPQRYSAMLAYDTSEFGRLRLQYNQDEADLQRNHAILLNYTVSFGAHGAHAY